MILYLWENVPKLSIKLLRKNAANGQQLALLYDLGQKKAMGTNTVNRVKNVHSFKNVHRVKNVYRVRHF